MVTHGNVFYFSITIDIMDGVWYTDKNTKEGIAWQKSR